MSDVCRICRGGETDGPLKVPCKCSGSISHVHEDCLLDWLSCRYGHSVRSEQSCELCGHVYEFKPVYSDTIGTQTTGFSAYLYEIWTSTAQLRVKAVLVLRALFMVLVASNTLYGSFRSITAFAEFLSSPSAAKAQNPLVIKFSFPIVNSARSLYLEPTQFASQLSNGFGLLVVTLVFVLMAWTISTWILQDPILALEVDQIHARGLELGSETEIRQEIELVKSLIRDANINAQARAQLLARIDDDPDQNPEWLPIRERQIIERNAQHFAEFFGDPQDAPEEGDDLWDGAEELFGGPLLSRIATFFMFLTLFVGVFVGVFYCLPYMVGYAIVSYVHTHLHNFGFTEVPKTFEARLLYFLMGFRVFLAFMESPYHNFARILRWSPHGRAMIATAKQIAAVEKVWVVVVTETVLFPLLSGTLLYIATTPIMLDPSLQNALADIYNHHRIYLPLLWAAGMCYMYTLSDFFKSCRRILRPGVLYFIQDPSDPKNEPIRNFLSSSLYTIFRKIGLSAIIYSFLILGCIGGVTSLFRLSGVVPTLIAPLDLKSNPGWTILRYWYLPFVAIHILKASLGSSNNDEDPDQYNRAYGWIYANELRRAANWFNLGSFLFDDQEDHPEGSGTYLRAPHLDNVALRKGIELFVPVDKDDNRLRPLKPGSRELEDYYVVWAPKYFWARVTLLVVWIWFVSILICATIAIVPLLVGRGLEYITMVKGTVSNDLVHYAFGAFTICTVATVVDSALLRRQTLGRLNEYMSVLYHGIMALFVHDGVNMLASAICPSLKEYIQPSKGWFTTLQEYHHILYALGRNTAPKPNLYEIGALLVAFCIPNHSAALRLLITGCCILHSLYTSPEFCNWRQKAVHNYYIIRQELQNYQAGVSAQL